MTAQVLALARRSVLRTLRQPAAIIPALIFPLFFLLVTSAGARSAANLPGFPADSYFEFVLAGAFVQGMMLAGINGGSDLALDVESGFMNRLALTPMRRVAVLAGHLAGTLTVGLIQVVVFLAVGLAAGADFAAGVGGILVLAGLALLVSLAFGAVGSLIALRTGSSEAVQGAFPLFFIVLGFSSFFLPRDLISVGWFKALATWNPASYLIEGLRSLVVTGWDGRALLLAFGLGGAVALLAFAAASAALGRRFAR